MNKVALCFIGLELALALSCKRTERPDPAPPQGKAPAVTASFYSDTFPDVQAMPKLDPAGLQSNDPREVMKMAQAYAASDDPAAQLVLQEALRDPTFYSRLDDDEALRRQPTTWRFASVMQVLRTNPSPAVHATIVSLCNNPAFDAHVGRADLLVQVLVSIRPSPPEAIAFWRRHGATGALYQHMVPHALADNGSVPAIALLEEQFLEETRPADDKRRWMRDGVIRHRFELPMIQAVERLVKSLPQDLVMSLVEVYFTYDERWYLSCDPPKPQPLSEATLQARKHYLAIAEHALRSLPLSAELRKQVEATRRLLDEELRLSRDR